MPDIKPGESRQDYVARCVPYVIKKEGATQKQALGKCFGMYDHYTKNEDIVSRLSKIIGDETVAGDIATNTAKGVINTGCQNGYTWDKKKERCVKTTNESDIFLYQGYAKDFIRDARFHGNITKPSQLKKNWANDYAKKLGLDKKDFWKAVNDIKNKEFKKALTDKDGYFYDSTVIGGAYIGSAGNIEGSGQTRTVGDRRGEIEILTRKPRPLKWNDILGIYVPDFYDGITEDVNESVSRYCSIYKAKNKKWYLELAPHEYGEYEDADTYGPFDSEDEADGFLSGFANPGGLSIDKSGKKPVPKKSPNGRKIISPKINNRW